MLNSIYNLFSLNSSQEEDNNEKEDQPVQDDNLLVINKCEDQQPCVDTMNEQREQLDCFIQEMSKQQVILKTCQNRDVDNQQINKGILINNQLQFVKEMKQTINPKDSQKHTNQDVISSIKTQDQASNQTQQDDLQQNQSTDSQAIDPITGVLKLKKNKNKKTKEVSLTINHNNLKALVQMLQAHSIPNETLNDIQTTSDISNLLLKAPSQNECTCDEQSDQVCSICSNSTFSQLDSNQQALQLIMQFISNNMDGRHYKTPCPEHEKFDSNCDTCQFTGETIGQEMANIAGNVIDPQMLEQLFSIDRQEDEECSDSSDEEYDDEDEDDDEESDENNLPNFGGDQSLYNLGKPQPKDQTKDDNKGTDSQGVSSNQAVYDCGSSDDDEKEDDFCDKVDLLQPDDINPSLEKNSVVQSLQDRQKMRDKLSKRKKTIEAQKAQNLHQQKISRMKQQQQTLKKGYCQKQYSEDNLDDQQQQNQQDEDQLECGEEYFNEYGKKEQATKYFEGDENVNSDCASAEDSARVPTQQKTGGNDTTVEGDNSSQYEDIDNDGQYLDEDEENDGVEDDASGGGEEQMDNINKLLKQKLKVSDKLSPQFHRFYEHFQQKVDFIIQFEYNILPQQKCFQNFGGNPVISLTSQDQSYYYLNDQRQRDTAQLILKKRYNNYRKDCEQNCKCFTGPHSVLQIFIEKIVQTIEKFASKLKILTKDELQLWIENTETKDSDDEKTKNLNELNYSINGIDLNVIFKMINQYVNESDSIKKGLIDGIKDGVDSKQKDSQVQQTLKMIEQQTKSQEAKDKLRQLGQMSDRDIKKLVQKAGEYLKNKKKQNLKFKPLLKNLDNYTNFLQNVICHYNLIIKQYAPAISRHFTEMTKVIKEGNSYEFPSQDIHRTIINKLIINDNQLFKHFFTHIKQEYKKHETQIKKKILQDPESKSSQNLKQFIEMFDQFSKDVEIDISKGIEVLNIDYYMRDLRKHALQEYEEVHQIELQITVKSTSGKEVKPENNEKLSQRYGLLQSQIQQNSPDQQWQALDAQLMSGDINNFINSSTIQGEMFDLSLLDAKEKKKLKKKQRKRDKKIKQQMAQHGLLPAEEINGGEENDGEEFDSGNGSDELNAFQTGFMSGQTNDQNYQDLYENFQKLYQYNDLDETESVNENDKENQNDQKKKNKQKKGKSGGKLSSEQIKNLTTEELCGYIENEDKKMKQAAAAKANLEASKQNPEGMTPQQIADSNKFLEMRLKAKAFMAQKKQREEEKSVQLRKTQKAVDPNNFTCKFCNGTIDQKSQKFAHEKFCLVAASNGNQQNNNEDASSREEKKKKEKETQVKVKKVSNPQATNNNDQNTTRGSSQTDKLEKEELENTIDEDRQIEEFAKTLEETMMRPPPRYAIIGGKRRRRKLKPNLSKDWLQKVKDEVQFQNSGEKRVLSDIESIEDMSYSSNPSPNGPVEEKKYQSLDASLQSGNRLSDLTTDQSNSISPSKKKQEASKKANSSISQQNKNVQSQKNKK